MTHNPSQMTGNVHTFTFDVETQGLRTRSYTLEAFSGRQSIEPIGISSISYGRAGKRAHLNAFTDILTPDLLERHGVTEQILDSGNLPDSLLNELVRKDGNYDPKKGPRWDPSLRERGSVLDGVFRRHAKAALNKGIVPQANVYQQLVDEWSAIKVAGGQVELAAWNVGYDMPTLFREIRRHGFGGQLDDLLKTNTMRVREMADSLHALRFEGMLRSNWTPVMSDRSIFEAAWSEGLQKLAPKDVNRLGGIDYHKGLREFINDVRGGKDAFKSRVGKWVEAKYAGSAQAQASAENLIERLSSVKDFESFKKFVEYGHANASAVVMGDMSVSQVLGEVYSGSRHAHILGDLSTLHSSMRYAPMEGMFSGFSFIGGGSLSEVTQSLIENKNDLDVSAETVTELHKLLGSAHDADADRRMMEVTSAELDRIRRHDVLTDNWIKIDQARSRISTERRMGQLYEDFVKSKASTTERSAAESLHGALRGGPRMKTSFGKVGDAMPWAMVIGGMAAAYVIGKHNEVEKPPEIQGLRRSVSDWDSIEGIDSSDLPFSNVSAFGSGYDSYEGMQQKPHRVRISKVIDGDTVEFFYNGQMTRARLAGVNTPETVRKGLPPQIGGPQASDFLKQYLSGQDVWVRPQTGDSIDKYGRSLVYADMNGVSVNAEIVRRGHSKALSQMPSPYFQGSEVVGYLKHRMQIGIDATIDQVSAVFGNDQRAPDPLIWTALGNVATLTDEDDNEFPAEEPVGYGGGMASAWRDTGYAGYVQQLSEDAMGSRIRDHATQLHRLPGMPRTRRGRRASSYVGHAERASMMGV